MSQKSARYEDPNTLPIYGPLLYFRADGLGNPNLERNLKYPQSMRGHRTMKSHVQTACSENIHMHPIVLLMKNHVGDDLYPRQRSTASKAAFPLPLSDAYCATCKSQENFYSWKELMYIMNMSEASILYVAIRDTTVDAA